MRFLYLYNTPFYPLGLFRSSRRESTSKNTSSGTGLNFRGLARRACLPAGRLPPQTPKFQHCLLSMLLTKLDFFVLVWFNCSDYGGVVKLVYTAALGAVAARRESSSLSTPTATLKQSLSFAVQALHVALQDWSFAVQAQI